MNELVGLLKVGTFVSIMQLLSSSAAAEIFTVDETRSHLTLSGTISVTVSGFGPYSGSIVPQGAGSLLTVYNGSINVERSEPTIAFPGASSIDARTNGNWQPANGAVPGNSPADYGGHAQFSTILGIFSVDFALRNVALELTSATLSVVAGNFNPQDLLFSFNTNANGTLEYLGSFSQIGVVPLTGTATNAASGLATLNISTNNFPELFIPVDVTYPITSGSLNGTSFRLQGQLTAVGPPLPPHITSFSVQNGVALLSVTNAIPEAILLTSSNLVTWVNSGLAVSNSAGFAFFTNSAAEPMQFFRIRN